MKDVGGRELSLNNWIKEHKFCLGYLFAHEPGVDGGPDVVGVHGARLPVYADDVAVLDQEEGEPHLPGPDLLAARAEAVDDDLGGQRHVEVAAGDGGRVQVVQHLRTLVIPPEKGTIRVIQFLYLQCHNLRTLVTILSPPSPSMFLLLPGVKVEHSPDFLWG